MSCQATNPATGKPYTRHKIVQRNLRVTAYSPRGGGMAPCAYAYEATCVRPGCNHTSTVRY